MAVCVSVVEYVEELRVWQQQTYGTFSTLDTLTKSQ